MENLRHPLVLTSSALVVLSALYQNVFFALIASICLIAHSVHDLFVAKIALKKVEQRDELLSKIEGLEKDLAAKIDKLDKDQEHLKNALSMLSRRV